MVGLLFDVVEYIKNVKVINYEYGYFIVKIFQ